MSENAQLEQALERTFSQGDLPFCTAPGYELSPGDHSLCELARAPGQRCPEFLRACEATPEAAPRSFDWPALSVLTDLLFWGVSVTLAFFVLTAILRALAERRRSVATDEERSAPRAPAETPEARPRLVETDVSRLLARAQRAASAGHFDQAVSALFGALVHGLGARGLLRVDPALTNGDYLRALSGQPELAREFRWIARSVERVQFGSQTASADVFAELWPRVTRILSSTAAALLLFVSASALSGCAAPPGAFESFDESPRGFGALQRLLAERGTRVRKRVSSLSSIDDDVAKIVYFASSLEPAQRALLLDWTSAGNELVVVGRDPELEKLLGVRVSDEDCGRTLSTVPAANESTTAWRLAAVGRAVLDLSKASAEPAPEVHLTCGGRPYAASLFFGDEGSVLVVAEPSFFGNASLSVGDNARFALPLLDAPDYTVELVGPWTGTGASSPLAAVRGAGLLPATLQLLAIALLLLLRQSAAFGARRDPVIGRRRAFVDHVRALGASYRKARASGWVLANYGAWAVERLRERTSRAEGSSLLALAAKVARQSGRREAEVVELLLEVRQAGESGGQEPADFRTLEKLESLVFPSGGKQ